MYRKLLKSLKQQAQEEINSGKLIPINVRGKILLVDREVLEEPACLSCIHVGVSPRNTERLNWKSWTINVKTLEGLYFGEEYDSSKISSDKKLKRCTPGNRILLMCLFA